MPFYVIVTETSEKRCYLLEASSKKAAHAMPFGVPFLTLKGPEQIAYTDVFTSAKDAKAYYATISKPLFTSAQDAELIRASEEESLP